MLGCRNPSFGDDKAGCISAHCGGKPLIADLNFSCSFLGAFEITAQVFGVV